MFRAILVEIFLRGAVFVGSEPVAVLSMGIAIGLGTYLAWVHRDWSRETRYQGLGAAMTGALIGAWLGFNAAGGLLAVARSEFPGPV